MTGEMTGLLLICLLAAAPLAVAPPPETASLPEPAPPLALTCAAPPFDEVPAQAVAVSAVSDSGA